MALFPFLVGGSEPGRLMNPAVILQSFLALSFVGSMNLAVNATMIDGQSFWIILCIPRSAMRKIFSKLLVSPFFFVPLAAAAAVAFRAAGIIGWGLVSKAVWLAACMSLVGGGVGIVLALSYGDWQWETPRRMLRTTGRFLMLGVMAIFFAAMTIVVSSGAARTDANFLEKSPPMLLIVITAACAAFTLALVRTAAARIERMEWTL
jgi:hypothetical protein